MTGLVAAVGTVLLEQVKGKKEGGEIHGVHEEGGIHYRYFDM